LEPNKSALTRIGIEYMIEKQGSNGIKQIGAATRKQSRSKTDL